MVNALFAALFVPTNVALNSRLWKNYLLPFLPYGGGDTMQVTVDFQCDAGGNYSLSRTWGAVKNCRLVTADGSVITGEERLQAKLAELLKYGRGTYEGILFARQEEMLQTVALLRQKPRSRYLGEIRHRFFAGGGVLLKSLL